MLRGQQAEAKREHGQPTERATNQEPNRQTAVPPRAAPVRVDPVVQARTMDFASLNPWLNLEKPDRATRIALMIDEDVAAEGFDPKTQDYWDELQTRLREAPELAHVVRPQGRQAPQRQQEKQPPAERRGPMVGAPGGVNPGSGTRTVRMSPDRKQALMEIGVLDRDGRTILDMSRFNRLAARYVEHDRTSQAVR
jgi:hypothetical protein